MPRTQTHHLHLPHVGFDGTRQMKLVYFMRVLRDLVNKIAYFFFPIYLFNSGQTWLEGNFFGLHLTGVQAGMFLIALYYLVYKIVMFFTAVPLGRLAIKWGYQRTIIWSYIIDSLYFLVLFLSLNHPELILVASIMDGVQANMFWPIYKTILTKSAHKSKMGSDLGLLQFFLQLVAVVSPAIAGLISLRLGFEVLFLIGLIGTLTGLVIVMMMNLKTDHDKPSFKEFFSWLKEKRYQRLALSQAGRYLSDTIIYLWPLYVYFLLEETSKVGFLYTLSLFLAMIVTMFTVSIIDKLKDKKAFKISGSILSLTWLARTQVGSVLGIALVDTVNQLISNFHWLYYDMILFRRGKGRKAHAYFVYYEEIMAVVGIIFWIIFMGIFLVMDQWHGLFILGALGVLLSLLITGKHEGVE